MCVCYVQMSDELEWVWFSMEMVKSVCVFECSPADHFGKEMHGKI